MNVARAATRLPIALRRGVMTAMKAVFLSVALAVSALGIPLPLRFRPVARRPGEAEVVHGADEPETDARRPGASS